MYIEDLIISLAVTRNVQLNPFDSKLIYSFYDQITKSLGFTEKQEILSVKVLKKQVTKLNLIFNKDISQFLENPVFRLTRRIVSSEKTISIVPHALLHKAIKVKFPYNEDLLSKIRQEKVKLTYADWSPTEKSWFFSLDERNLNFLENLAKEEKFDVDEEFENYQNQIKEIKEHVEDHVPMVTFDGENVKFINIPSKIDQPTNVNIIENLFRARKLGIFTWDETIETTDEWKNVDPLVIKFLQTDPKEDFSINLEKNEISSLHDIIKNLFPVLVIIPGGTELQTLTLFFDFLKSIGFSNNEMSVLFRLPTESGGNFNNFIKEQKLNSPIGENTKVVFISSKVPKTIIENKLKFNCLVNFNFFSIHYSIKNLLRWHHNVINLAEKDKQKGFDFAFV